jgi:hypothetical protein
MTACSDAPQGLTLSQARAAGGLYLGTIATGIFAEGFARSGLAVKGDAVATAQNILSQEALYRAGLASDVVMLCLYIAVTMLLYAMFTATSRKVSLIAAGFSMAGIAVLAASSLPLFIPLLQPATATQPDDPGGQGLNDVTLQALALHAEGYGVSLVFFGTYCVLLGYLIWRSGLVPRTIGVLMAIGGAAHLISSFAGIAAPPVAQQLPSQLLMLPLLGELALSLWLLLFGIRQPGQVVRA